MKYLILIFLLLGCTDTKSLRIGEKVSNGVCSGWIAQANSYEYKVVPWQCKEVTFSFAWIPKNEVHSIDKDK